MQPIDILSESEGDTARPPTPKCHPKPSCQRGRSSRTSSLPPVDELSASSSEDQQDLLELGMRRGRKRKKKQADHVSIKERLCSEVHCRAMLAKRCAGCKRLCLLGFLQKTRFKDVMEFRKLWNDMHKLDQDRMVGWICASKDFVLPLW